MNLILENVPLIFGDRIVEKGFRKAFKGDWGSEKHTKRPGLLQDLSRLSYWSFIAQLRKTNIHIDADGAKSHGAAVAEKANVAFRVVKTGVILTVDRLLDLANVGVDDNRAV